MADRSLKIESKRSFLDRNIHHYKNHNIFEGPVDYSRDKSPEDSRGSKSSLIRKSKLGALYHPHEVDPYQVARDPIAQGPAAGVSTNYGISKKIIQERSDRKLNHQRPSLQGGAISDSSSSLQPSLPYQNDAHLFNSREQTSRPRMIQRTNSLYIPEMEQRLPRLKYDGQRDVSQGRPQPLARQYSNAYIRSNKQDVAQQHRMSNSLDLRYSKPQVAQMQPPVRPNEGQNSSRVPQGAPSEGTQGLPAYTGSPRHAKVVVDKNNSIILSHSPTKITRRRKPKPAERLPTEEDLALPAITDRAGAAGQASALYEPTSRDLYGLEQPNHMTTVQQGYPQIAGGRKHRENAHKARALNSEQMKEGISHPPQFNSPPGEKSQSPGRRLVSNRGVAMPQRKHFSTLDMPVNATQNSQDMMLSLRDATTHVHPNHYQRLQNDQDSRMYHKDMLLLEQDAYLLEEARYLNRLQASEAKQQKNVDDFRTKIVVPEIQRLKHEDEKVEAQIEHRRSLQNEVIEAQSRLRKELSNQNAELLKRQMDMQPPPRRLTEVKRRYK